MAVYESIPMRVEAEQWFRGKEVKGVTDESYQSVSGAMVLDAWVVTIHGHKTPIVEGDWILPEPDGEHYYPVKDEIFKKKYRLVE